MDKKRLANIQARYSATCYNPRDYDAANLLKHIEEQDAEIERLLAALRETELGCLHPTDGRTVGGFDPGRGRYTVVRCWVCKREIQIYVVSMERVGKHVKSCVFAMLED